MGLSLTVPATEVKGFILCGMLADSLHKQVNVALYEGFLLPEGFVAEGVG